METEKVIHSDNDFASVAFLRVKSAELVPKPSIPHAVALVPPILEEEFIGLKSAVLASQNDPSIEDLSNMLGGTHIFYHPAVHLATTRRRGPWVVVSNVQAAASLNENDITIEEEVSQCFCKLAGRLLGFETYVAHLVI